jgi:hypothetical protein
METRMLKHGEVVEIRAKTDVMSLEKGAVLHRKERLGLSSLPSLRVKAEEEKIPSLPPLRPEVEEQQCFSLPPWEL